MDAKITLSFDENTIKKAEVFAARNGMSLSRLTEFVYRQMTMENYTSLDDMPIADWIGMVADKKAEYVKPRSRKTLNSEFYEAVK